MPSLNFNGFRWVFRQIPKVSEEFRWFPTHSNGFPSHSDTILRLKYLSGSGEVLCTTWRAAPSAVMSETDVGAFLGDNCIFWRFRRFSDVFRRLSDGFNAFGSVLWIHSGIIVTRMFKTHYSWSPEAFWTHRNRVRAVPLQIRRKTIGKLTFSVRKL